MRLTFSKFVPIRNDEWRILNTDTLKTINYDGNIKEINQII